MTWWNIIKVAGQEMAGDTEAVDDGGIKPAETMEEAREHPIDPALAEKALTGGQKKLDKDKDGDIDAEDFKALRDGAMRKSIDEFLLAVDDLVKSPAAHMNPNRKINVRLRDVHNLHIDISELAEELKDATDEGEFTRITGELKQKIAALKKLKHHSSSGYI